MHSSLTHLHMPLFMRQLLTTRLFTCLAVITALTACTTHTPRPTCHLPSEITPEMLVGEWIAQVIGQPSLWTVTLVPHPEHAGSLRGVVRQGGQRFQIVADLEDGEFTMEETYDGLRIAATWLGTPQIGTCGNTIQGQRTPSDHASQPFTLTRQTPPSP